jgi:hypothetical protein
MQSGKEERVRYVDWRPHRTAPPRMGSMEKDILCNKVFKNHKDLADWFKRDEEITSTIIASRNAKLDEKIKRCQAAIAKMEEIE